MRVTSGDGRTVQVTALGRACEACAEGVLCTKIGCEKQLICGANSLREFGRMPDFPRGINVTYQLRLVGPRFSEAIALIPKLLGKMLFPAIAIPNNASY